jgi:hypothetical protein
VEADRADGLETGHLKLPPQHAAECDLFQLDILRLGGDMTEGREAELVMSKSSTKASCIDFKSILLSQGLIYFPAHLIGHAIP